MSRHNRQLVSTPFSLFPTLNFPFDENLGKWAEDLPDTSGISVYEESNYVCVEASMPGLKPQNIEITFNKGTLWIKGKKEEDSKNKKFYQKAVSSFSYCIQVPGNIDESKQPEAIYKEGILLVKFAKNQETEPKKIPVTAGA